MNKWSIYFYIIFFSFFGTSSGLCKSGEKKIRAGIEFGTWKPNNLRTTDTPFTVSFSAKYLYVGSYLITPLTTNLSLRLSIGHFNYSKKEDDAVTKNKSITLIPILFDIKYSLIQESSIVPFVSYGGGIWLGDKNLSQIVSLEIDKNSIGYGLNLGTGIDFLLSEHWSLGLEFSYHYLKFSKILIFTNDYSGPKINFSIYYQF